MVDVALYFSFAACYVLFHAYAAFFPWPWPSFVYVGATFIWTWTAVVIGFYGIKVLILHDEGASSSQFPSLAYRAYPWLMLCLSTLAATGLTAAAVVGARGPTYLGMVCAYFVLVAGADTWLLVQNPNAYVINAQGQWGAVPGSQTIQPLDEDYVALAGLWLFPLFLVGIVWSELLDRDSCGAWMLRGMHAPKDKARELPVNTGHLLYLFPLPLSVIIVACLLQAYMDLRFFLNPTRLFISVILVDLLPFVFSFLVDVDNSAWLHARLVMDAARWVCFCGPPAFSFGLSWATQPTVYAFSQWLTTDVAAATEGSLFFFAIATLVYQVTYWLMPFAQRALCCFRRAKRAAAPPGDREAAPFSGFSVTLRRAPPPPIDAARAAELRRRKN